MRMMWALSCLLMCAKSDIVWANGQVATEMSHTLNLNPGQSKIVNFPVGIDLNVSRRGVVDLFHVGQGRWQITGLRSGIVVVDATSSATPVDRPNSRLLVQVADLSEAEERLTQQIQALPSWICGQPGVNCRRDLGVVSGKAPSMEWFGRARRACRLFTGCQLDLSVDDDVFLRWLAKVQHNLGENYRVTSTHDFVALASTICGDHGKQPLIDELDALTSGAVTDGQILLRCIEDNVGPSYKLQVRMYSIHSSEANAIGLDGRINATADLPTVGVESGILARLEALAGQRRAEMVAEPVMRVLGNQTVELASGSEFQVLGHLSGPPRTGATAELTNWKHQGIKIKLKIVPVKDAKIRVSYELTYRERVSGQMMVNVNELKSDVDAEIGKPVMAGILDLRGHGSEQSTIPLLSGLPVIGPLLAKSSAQDLNSRLVLWFQVLADAEHGDLEKAKF